MDVSLNKGMANVKLKSGNTLRPEELWEAVRRNGFTPKQTSVVVRGEVDGGKLKVTGAFAFLTWPLIRRIRKALTNSKARHRGYLIKIRGTPHAAKRIQKRPYRFRF